MTIDKKALLTQVRRVQVGEAAAGMRLDRFLRDHLPGVPTAALHRLLRTGQVRLNGGRVAGNERLVVGSEVRLPPVRLEEPSQERGGEAQVPDWAMEQVQGRILWQDGKLLVLDKPTAMAVHGGSGQPWGVVDVLRRCFAAQPEEQRLELCHRLDRDTSGCLLFGFGKEMARAMTEAFRHDQVEKRYLALVLGEPPEQGESNQPLIKGVTRAGERMVVAGERGAEARTQFKVVERFAECTLMEARLITGRTHQIRVHFQDMGFPVAGDAKYGDWPFNRQLRTMGLRRLFLHARLIAFRHPHTGRKLTVEAPLDTALNEVLARLRGSGSAG